VNSDVVIEDSVTSNCDPLEIKGNGSITVKSGGCLVVTSSTGLTGDGDLVVEDGGCLEVQGDLNITGSGTFQLDGEADVEGDLNVKGNGTATGTGDLDLGGSGCSNWEGSGSCSENVALPVELLSFEAIDMNGAVELRWATASETDCDHYIVQRKEEGRAFQKVDRIEGGGTSTYRQDYTLMDHEVPEGRNLYYRLVQMDLDGERTIYDPVAVHTETTQREKGMGIHPNPVRDRAVMEVPALKDRDPMVEIRVYDPSNGRSLVRKEYQMPSNGEIVFSKEEFRLEKGVYIVSVRPNSTPDERYTHRMVVE
jgi:hypothetical protein